jgi:acetyl esterase/lipase
VTIVSFNYRLNIFGFPNAPQLTNSSTSVNFGLLDIKAAIDWVYQNVEAFGGDPERITLFGESAGGVATDVYAFANENDRIVKGELLDQTIYDKYLTFLIGIIQQSGVYAYFSLTPARPDSGFAAST